MSRTKQSSSDGLKRKRDDKDDISTLATKPAATSPSLSAKIDEKNGTTKQARRKLNKIPDVLDIDEAIGHMDNSLLADHFAKQIRRHLGDLSIAELDEKYMPSKAFLNTSEFESTRNLSTLPQYIEKYTPGGRDELKDTVEATSSPHTLFIASSGIRAADLTRFVELQELYIVVLLTSVSRSLRVFQSDKSTVAKLFAKHIKLAESIEYVKKTR
jgi:protein CMS1